mmetsp:Transcript_124082/g.397063  ORF Transcript_124082/g.397063 Transcript_124082/m.397063 type:complete len:747 (+) Transcript_124082:89-2329(+)
MAEVMSDVAANGALVPLSAPPTLAVWRGRAEAREQISSMVNAGLHVFNPDWQRFGPGTLEPGMTSRGKKYSATFRDITLKIFGSGERLSFPVQTCTKVGDVKEALASALMVDAIDLEFLVKQGCSTRKQLDHEEVARQVIIKGIISFKAQAHKWEHPTAVIGAGYHGLKTCMIYAKSGNSNFVCFDRNDKVGGYCWITAANKNSKLQTEFGSFHVWWGEEMVKEGVGYPTKDWGIWPRKDKVLEHFQFAAEHYGLLPHIRFNCNVANIDTIGGKKDHGRYYMLGVQSLTDSGKSDQVPCSVIYNFPGSMTKNRIIDYPGEDEFDGHIGYGMNDDCPYEHLEGNTLAILGNGAFAVENARTAIEYGATKVYMVTRRKNLASPRVPCWFVHQGPLPTPGALVLKMFEPMYKLAGFDSPWDYWSVHATADRARVNIIQNSRFGIGDVTFLAVACGKLVYVEDTLKRCTRHTLHLTSGEKLEGVKVLLKSLGLLGDYEVDRLHKMKQMVGSYCDGDWRRVLMIDATGMNAANFTTFSTGIGTKGFVMSHKYLHDHPKEYYKMEKDGYLEQLPTNPANEKEDKPAYVVDVRYSMSSAIIMETMCPRCGAANAGDPIYKHKMYHAAHPLDYFLEIASKEWDDYQATWKTQGCTAPYVPYPYTREMIEGYFKEYSTAHNFELSPDGKTDHWDMQGLLPAEQEFGSAPAWANNDSAMVQAQAAIDNDHIRWWSGQVAQKDSLKTKAMLITSSVQ